MKCEEIRHLLHAYLDTELDAIDSLTVEQHLQSCATCARAFASYQALRAAFEDSTLYFSAPAQLRQRIQRSLPQVRPARRVSRLNPWLSAAALLLLLLGGFVLWATIWSRSTLMDDPHIAQAVVNSHERSLVSSHLVDLPTSNPDTLKTWFESRLGFSPPVINLTLQGYTLVGGRQDFLENQAVAAVVYKRDQHVINLFIWPATQSTKQRTLSLQGYYLTHWTNYGIDCWAVADLDEDQLQQFARLIDQRLRTFL